MSLRIEDYALIGDTQTAALVGNNGSIDWLCTPNFHSGACFAALLGSEENGHWALAPAAEVTRVHRRYRPGTLVLETVFETAAGSVRIVDCMPPRTGHPHVVRLVEGISGTVEMRMRLIVRFDYGSILPWVRRKDGVWQAVAGPDAVALRTPVALKGEDFTTVASFSVRARQTVPFVLASHSSWQPVPDAMDGAKAVADTERWWTEWSSRLHVSGPWEGDVCRSLLTLKALTFAPTGGIVAAATTSLPEVFGGVRNWDYRYCWVRDATFTLYSLMTAGYMDEARDWRDWLLRAAAGDASKLQVLYGPLGERRIEEAELPWLTGYEGSRPVRVGNAAINQFQIDIYGEVLDALHQARGHGIEEAPFTWALQKALMEFLESAWMEPDEGIWEVRGPRRHFTHSKVMAWVGADRMVRGVEHSGLSGPVDRWRQLRQDIHTEVCRSGFDAELGSFTQSFGSRDLDASLLLIPLVGFLPAKDDRVVGTVDAIRRELYEDGFVRRYAVAEETNEVDGLPGREGCFLACTFWFADNLALQGHRTEAVAIFDRLRGLANDVGLLAEEYDPVSRRLCGNFPQAFSHVSLVNTASNLSAEGGPAHRRADGRRDGSA